MRIIAFMNQKGGVGKTTTAVNLGACLAKLGRKVLLIDIDPQANSSIHLGIDIYKTKASIYNVLLGEMPVAKAVKQTKRKNFDIIPSNIDLSGAEVELASAVGRETILRDALLEHVREGGHYDYVLIDCPPSLGLLSLNALTTASEVFIPVQTQFFALQGMGKLLDVVNLVKRRLNPNLDLSGIILTMFDRRTNLAHEVVEEVRKYFKEKVFASTIRSNVRIAEAPGHGKTIIEYDPNSSGAKDYMELAREVAGVEMETEPMVWPPPGLEDEARRAEAKLRELVEQERSKTAAAPEGLAEVGLESVDASEFEQEEKAKEEPDADSSPEAAPSPTLADIDREIQNIKQMIELASGEGFMTVAKDEPAAAETPVQTQEPPLPSPIYDDITSEKPSTEEEVEPTA
jgi:chromosome partitioning protein